MRRPLFAVCLCLVILTAVWSGISVRGDSDVPEPENGSFLTVTGQVYQKSNQSFSMKSVTIKSISNQTFSFPYRILCESTDASIMTNIRLGSQVDVQGVYYDYARATNPGEFDADAYYRTLQISGKIKDVQIIQTGEEYSVLPEMLQNIRVHWRHRLYQVFPEKEASIMTAMLLGDKEELDDEVKNLYRQNGIIHILSISGLHVSVIGMGIYRLLRKVGLPPWMAAMAGGSILVLYGILSGMSVSACRAIGMYLIRMLAQVLGRTYDALTALGVMAVVIVFSNPGYLYHQGFLLSFGAILGITVLAPMMFPIKETKVWQTVCVSLSISLVTLPIQLWFYYEVPVYSLFLNLLVLPFMGVVMTVGLIVMIVPGTGGLGTVDLWILEGYEKVCIWAERLPFHTWNPGCPGMWQIIAYYGILLLAAAGSAWYREGDRKADYGGRNDDGRIDSQRRNDVRRVNAGKISCRKIRLLLWILPILAVAILGIRSDRGNQVTFLDVGQGDGIVLETSTGQVYLFDCGSSSRSQVGKYVLLPYLKYRGIHSIDAVFLSHGDIDHMSGIKELLENAGQESIHIGQLVLPDMEEEKREEEFGSLLLLVENMESPVPIGYLKAGDSWHTKKADFICLHPPEGSSLGGNAGSECIYIQLGEEGACGSLLLTGDVEGEGEQLLLEELKERGICKVSLLKVAHHGSRNSTSEEFLGQTRPAVSIISCGRDNSYGHPHEQLLDRLEEQGCYVMQTSIDGAITVRMKKGKMTVKEYVTD